MFDIELTICERFHISPFELRTVKFREFITFLNRLSDYNYRESKKYKTVRNPDGTYRHIKKVYANDNE